MAKQNQAPPVEPDDDIEEDDHVVHLREMNAEMMGTVVEVSVDKDPGVLLHYLDGRVLRVIANSQFTAVVPIKQGRVH